MANNLIPEHFADTTVNISLTGGLVRIDFGSIRPDPDNPQNTPELSTCHRVIMPLNGFIKMFGDLNGMVQKLEQSGVLGRTNQAGGQPAGQGMGQGMGQAMGPATAHSNLANEFRLDTRGMPAAEPKK
ncbi:MAG: hypothetical protein QM529_01040 [Hydrotalea sp.]|nr:hypothetical protein [Hydrotalea sp.]